MLVELGSVSADALGNTHYSHTRGLKCREYNSHVLFGSEDGAIGIRAFCVSPRMEPPFYFLSSRSNGLFALRLSDRREFGRVIALELPVDARDDPTPRLL